MAYLEGQVVGTSNTALSVAQSVSGTNTTVKSTNVFDVAGSGVGTTPSMVGPVTGNVGSLVLGGATALGTDFGAGQGVAHPGVLFTVTTTGTGSGTISFGVEAAPDSGTGTEGTYTLLSTTGGFVGTTLLAGTTPFQYFLPLSEVPPTFVGRPRFYAALYTIVGTAAVSVSASVVMNPPDVSSVGRFGKNYIVAA